MPVPEAPEDPETGDAPSAGSGLEWLWLAGIVAVAAALRLHDLTAGDVWVDEANSILTARYPVPALLERLGTDSSPPLFYVLLRGWAGLFGEGTAWLRGLSLLSGLALVVAVARLGRLWVSPRAALLAAWALAVSPQQIVHAQQVRMYALLALLAVLSLYFLGRLLAGGSRRHAVGWALATLAALYTHNFAFHLLPVQAVWIGLSGRMLRDWKRWLAVAGVGLLAYLPWLPTLLVQVANGDHYAWYAPLWEAKGALGTAYQMLLAFSPAGELVVKHPPDAVPGWIGLPALAFAGLAVFGAVRLARERQGFERFALASAVLLPVGTSLSLSLLLTPHFVPGRVDQLMAPFFALLAGAGIAALPGRALVAALAASLLLGSLAAKPLLYPDFTAYGYEGSDHALALAVEQRWKRGDAILCTSLTRASLEYYLTRDLTQDSEASRSLARAIHSFPRDTALHLGSQNDARWLAAPEELARERSASLAAALASLEPPSRLHVARVLDEINHGLAPTRLRALGLRLSERVGPFQQTDTGQRIVLEIYSLPAGGAASRRLQSSTPKRLPGRSAGSP